MKLVISNVEEMKKGGVYKITNTENGKVYIGSTHNFAERFSVHNRRCNQEYRATTPLYLDMVEYGSDKFEFEIIACVEDDEERVALENFYIQYYSHKGEIYNVMYKAYLVKPHTEETKRKMSLSHLTEREWNSEKHCFTR